MRELLIVLAIALTSAAISLVTQSRRSTALEACVQACTGVVGHKVVSSSCECWGAE